ncbi:MAG: hypothetical protein ACFFDK_14145 [Promethearchaeota archaeon]
MLFFYDKPGFDEQFGNTVFSSILIPIIIVLIYYIIGLILALWVYKNTKKRNMNSKGWFIGILLTGLIGFIVYLTIRDPPSAE